jgi:two-component system, NtrC family, response regulator GlrR
MIGQSALFLRAVRLLAKFATCDVPVVIEGETGTGKEVAARAIHYESARRNGPFIPVNCGALPDSLIENELFGHRRGAFTDARADFPGLLRLAHAGTLFLDEVDALTPRGQVTLLRFLQDKRFRPLGGTGEESADVRIVAASNRPLDALAHHGHFRMDLLYRLKVMYVRMPPLRERPGDPRLLAEHFLRHLSEQYQRPFKRVHPMTLQWLDRYEWPGNVRELENLISREFFLAETDEILFTGDESTAPSPGDAEPSDYRTARARALAAFDTAFLTALLTRHGGNITRAAQAAGKERRALSRLLKKYRIEPRRSA